MFTGIITALGKVKSVEWRGKNLGVRVATPPRWRLAAGESVSVDGVCSTIARISPRYFEVSYTPETLHCTTAKELAAGKLVNLERPLRFGDRFHGHVVQGHVDAAGKVMHIAKKGNSRVIQVAFPKELGKFVARKGSICVNGVSLTVVASSRGWCMIALIPYTIRHTNLGMLEKGDRVNIEIDLMARYRAQFISHAGKKT